MLKDFLSYRENEYLYQLCRTVQSPSFHPSVSHSRDDCKVCCALRLHIFILIIVIIIIIIIIHLTCKGGLQWPVLDDFSTVIHYYWSIHSSKHQFVLQRQIDSATHCCPVRNEIAVENKTLSFRRIEWQISSICIEGAIDSTDTDSERPIEYKPLLSIWVETAIPPVNSQWSTFVSSAFCINNQSKKTNQTILSETTRTYTTTENIPFH